MIRYVAVNEVVEVKKVSCRECTISDEGNLKDDTVVGR